MERITQEQIRQAQGLLTESDIFYRAGKRLDRRGNEYAACHDEIQAEIRWDRAAERYREATRLAQQAREILAGRR